MVLLFKGELEAFPPGGAYRQSNDWADFSPPSPLSPRGPPAAHSCSTHLGAWSPPIEGCGNFLLIILKNQYLHFDSTVEEKEMWGQKS